MSAPWDGTIIALYDVKKQRLQGPLFYYIYKRIPLPCWFFIYFFYLQKILRISQCVPRKHTLWSVELKLAPGRAKQPGTGL